MTKIGEKIENSKASNHNEIDKNSDIDNKNDFEEEDNESEKTSKIDKTDLYSIFCSLIMKSIDEEHERYAYFLRKAYGFITITIAIIAFVLSTFDYNLLFKKCDILVNNLTIIFSCVFIFGCLFVITSFVLMIYSTKGQKIELFDNKAMLENINNGCYNDVEEFYNKSLNNALIKQHESYSEKVRLRKLYFNIGLIFGSIGLFLIIFCYVALRIIVNR